MTADRKKLIFIVAGVLLLIFSSVAATDAARHDGDILYNPVDSVFKAAGFEVIVENDGTETAYDPLAASRDASAPQPDILVNINTAYENELAEFLPGIGEKKAHAIVEYRQLVGGFNSVEELLQVEGIGEGIYAKMFMYCTVAGPRVVSVETVSSSDKG